MVDHEISFLHKMVDCETDFDQMVDCETDFDLEMVDCEMMADGKKDDTMM